MDDYDPWLRDVQCNHCYPGPARPGWGYEALRDGGAVDWDDYDRERGEVEALHLDVPVPQYWRDWCDPYPTLLDAYTASGGIIHRGPPAGSSWR